MENLIEIALLMKQDFLPFAQATLHLAMAYFRAAIPPKGYVVVGIAELLEFLKDELGDFEKMQYVKILTHRLEFLMDYYDTTKIQGLMGPILQVYLMVRPYQ